MSFSKKNPWGVSMNSLRIVGHPPTHKLFTKKTLRRIFYEHVRNRKMFDEGIFVNNPLYVFILHRRPVGPRCALHSRSTRVEAATFKGFSGRPLFRISFYL